MTWRCFRLGLGAIAVAFTGCGDDGLPLRDGAISDAPVSDAAVNDDAFRPMDGGASDGGFDTGLDADLVDGGSDGGPTSDTGPLCDDSLWPEGLRLVSHTYEEVSGNPFGAERPDDLLVELTNRSVASLELTTPAEPFRRRIIFEDPPTSHNEVADSSFLMTVSDCPGDVTNGARCFLQIRGTHGTTTLLSTRAEDIGSDRYCHLEPGQRYYLNFVASLDPFDTPPACRESDIYDSRRCAVFFIEGALR